MALEEWRSGLHQMHDANLETQDTKEVPACHARHGAREPSCPRGMEGFFQVCGCTAALNVKILKVLGCAKRCHDTQNVLE